MTPNIPITQIELYQDFFTYPSSISFLFSFAEVFWSKSQTCHFTLTYLGISKKYKCSKAVLLAVIWLGLCYYLKLSAIPSFLNKEFMFNIILIHQVKDPIDYKKHWEMCKSFFFFLMLEMNITRVPISTMLKWNTMCLRIKIRYYYKSSSAHLKKNNKCEQYSKIKSRTPLVFPSPSLRR